MIIEKKATKFALVICTINRSTLIEGLLTTLLKQSSQPDCVVIVDSSLDDLTKRVAEEFEVPFHLHYVRSLKGLPHQRNVGVKAIDDLFGLKKFAYVGFLDDDVLIENDYFEFASRAFAENPLAVLIGGYDKNLPIRKASRIEEFLMLNCNKPGHVLLSGLVTYVKPSKEYEEVVWLPGHSFNVRSSAFEFLRFRGQARIHGEDVEMQLRLSQLGEILVAKELGVIHHRSDVYRDSLRNAVAFDDGFRFWLGGQRPEIVKKRWVIVTSILLASRSLLLIFSKDGITHRLILKGHLDFFWRLISRKQIEQFVEHNEWESLQDWTPKF